MKSQMPEAVGQATKKRGMSTGEPSIYNNVINSYKSGTLKSSAGNRVVNPKQAEAIAGSMERRRSAYERAMRG